MPFLRRPDALLRRGVFWCIEARLQRISDEGLGTSVSRASDLPELFGPSFHLLVKEPKPNVQPPATPHSLAPGPNQELRRARGSDPKPRSFEPTRLPRAPTRLASIQLRRTFQPLAKPDRTSDWLTFDSPAAAQPAGSTEAPPDDRTPTSSSPAAVRTHPGSDTSCNLRRGCRPHPDLGTSTRLTLRAPLRTPSTDPRRDPLPALVTRHIEPVTLHALLRTPSTKLRRDPLLASVTRRAEPVTTHRVVSTAPWRLRRDILRAPDPQRPAVTPSAALDPARLRPPKGSSSTSLEGLTPSRCSDPPPRTPTPKSRPSTRPRLHSLVSVPISTFVATTRPT